MKRISLNKVMAKLAEEKQSQEVNLLREISAIEKESISLSQKIERVRNEFEAASQEANKKSVGLENELNNLQSDVEEYKKALKELGINSTSELGSVENRISTFRKMNDSVVNASKRTQNL
jgi:uncharacterized coiled-coil DUF342 family protein